MMGDNYGYAMGSKGQWQLIVVYLLYFQFWGWGIIDSQYVSLQLPGFQHQPTACFFL